MKVWTVEFYNPDHWREGTFTKQDDAKELLRRVRKKIMDECDHEDCNCETHAHHYEVVAIEVYESLENFNDKGNKVGR